MDLPFGHPGITKPLAAEHRLVSEVSFVLYYPCPSMTFCGVRHELVVTRTWTLFFAILVGTVGCSSGPPDSEPAAHGVLSAAFVVLDGVYNSELMAPYDVLHHSIFRDSLNYVEPYVVSPDGTPVTTFEGLTIHAHHSFDTAPPAHILVIPSTLGSMDRDLANEEYIDWIREAADQADWVVTVCDGTFPLAATDLLSGYQVTTFPADRHQLAGMFTDVTVRFDSRLVVHDKFISSVGGAMSYEPALYLVQRLYGVEHAVKTAEGIALDWDLTAVPHTVVQ